ncbi:MAG: pyrimidine 5'-nucleotidase [Paracoccaceae bacterium]
MTDATATDPVRARFAAARDWVFDLDDTLYPADRQVIERINARMTAFVMRELGLDRARADDLRSRYWRRYGITLTGLVAHHGVEADAFLAEVHDIDLSTLAPDPRLNAALARLGARPGTRLVVHTNGSRAHAGRVLDRLGLAGAFERVFAIEDKGLVPKPRPEAHAQVVREAGLDPTRAAMAEDKTENLVVPKRLGMATLLVGEGTRADAHVDARAERLSCFLAGL